MLPPNIRLRKTIWNLEIIFYFMQIIIIWWFYTQMYT